MQTHWGRPDSVQLEGHFDRKVYEPMYVGNSGDGCQLIVDGEIHIYSVEWAAI